MAIFETHFWLYASRGCLSAQGRAKGRVPGDFGECAAWAVIKNFQVSVSEKHALASLHSCVGLDGWTIDSAKTECTRSLTIQGGAPFSFCRVQRTPIRIFPQH